MPDLCSESGTEDVLITHFSHRHVDDGDVPFIIVNCVFKYPEGDEYTDQMKQLALSESEDYRRVLCFTDAGLKAWKKNPRPELCQQRWMLQEPVCRYLKKFDSFWFREWIADCEVTRACIRELEHYRQHGRFADVYRMTNQSVVLHHLRTFDRYWD